LLAAVACCALACGRGRDTDIRRLDALFEDWVSGDISAKDARLIRGIGVEERKHQVFAWCAGAPFRSVKVCQDLYQSAWTAGDAEAYQSFAAGLCSGQQEPASAFFQKSDLALRALLTHQGPCSLHLSTKILAEDVGGVLATVDRSLWNLDVMGALLPRGPQCAAESSEWLEGAATPAKAALARALIAGPCGGFLAQVLRADPGLLARYRSPIGSELPVRSPGPDSAIRLMDRYGLVRAMPARFQAEVPGQILESIRQPLPWVGSMARGHFEAVAAHLDGGDRALAASVLDFLEQVPEDILARGSLDDRDHLLAQLAVADRVRSLGRSVLASRIGGPPEALFRREVDGLAARPPAEMAAFLGSGRKNPLAGDLVDRLSALPVPAVAITFDLEGEEAARIPPLVEARVRAVLGEGMVFVCATGRRACDRATRRVETTVKTAETDACFVSGGIASFFTRPTSCDARGRAVTIGLVHFRQGAAVTRQTILVKTPESFDYSAHVIGGGLPPPPTVEDVWAATIAAVERALADTLTRIPV
jgi:hypothetical protein